MAERIESLRLIWLEALVEIERSKSFSEAARVLGCSHQMVSRYMKQLTDWYGVDIFEPGERGNLTAVGRKFARTAQLVIALLTESRRNASKAEADSPTSDDEDDFGKKISWGELAEIMHTWRKMGDALEKMGGVMVDAP